MTLPPRPRSPLATARAAALAAWLLVPTLACEPAPQPFAQAALPPPVWFQLDDAAPESDELLGYTLRAGRVGSPASITLDLPPEAFVAGPFGDDVLVGQFDGTRSTLERVRADDGARALVVESELVLRRALLIDGDLYVHVLDPVTRDERGLWRFDATRDGPQSLDDGELVLPGLPRDRGETFGPTFETLLREIDGGVLVQTCGEILCRTRALDVQTGVVTLRDEIGQGEIIGVVGRTLYTWEAGNGWPAKVRAIDLDKGGLREVAFAYGAVVAHTEDGAPALVYESGDVPGELRLQALAGEAAQEPDRVLARFNDDTLHPVPHTDLSLSGLMLPDGFIALGGDGRVAAPGAPPDPLLLRLRDGVLFETAFDSAYESAGE